mmetsp:Transcript_20553/g.59520  ORF Transcript_20553/g.59520 Transcript_20553/m.59520 type:complete len:404 (-) Transcript_20553:21-1232(-)
MIRTSFGLDVLLYLVLLITFIWRQVAPWQCCRRINSCISYISVFYLLVLCLLISEVVQASLGVNHFMRGNDHRAKVFGTALICCLPIMFLIMAMSWLLTRKHMDEMKAGMARMKHERAVHIIALPSVYGVMAVCSFVKLYDTLGSDTTEQDEGIALARYETCIYVADLYEAWALYQFGKLTLELLDETFEQRQALVSSRGPGVRHQKATKEDRERNRRTWQQDSTRDVVLSFTAVSSLAWLGTWLLVVVCLVQAGYSLWLWCFHDPQSKWIAMGADFHKFSYAGMVASGAAIYNVHTIEQTFGHLIAGYSPLLKFLSVKFLVFFAFWQTKILLLLRTIHILPLSIVEVKLLHSVLLVLECLASAIMHSWAWGAKEVWYGQDESKGESQPLSSGQAPSRGSTMI